MPWKESYVVEERFKFVIRHQNGEKIASLCREFGISRKTGYKILTRFEKEGVDGLSNQSRRPFRLARRINEEMEFQLLKIKEEKPDWGAAKIREIFLRRNPQVKPPAKSTVHALFDRHDLVQKRKWKRIKAQGTFLAPAKGPNDLWCADFKGQFRLGNSSYCYPLTITDYHSRYLLCCEGFSSNKVDLTFGGFQRAFEEHGLPLAIRTDNGVPFSFPRSLFGLSHLSVWWLRLGIRLERIQPGHPEQNGRHERMHLTLKKATAKKPKANFLEQQERFDEFCSEFNHERPHESLQMKFPGEVYVKSPRAYQGLLPLEYPQHDRTGLVTSSGDVCLQRKKFHLSRAFAKQEVGLLEVDDGIWLVSFMDCDLGYFDETSLKFAKLDNPFAINLSTKV